MIAASPASSTITRVASSRVIVVSPSRSPADRTCGVDAGSDTVQTPRQQARAGQRACRTRSARRRGRSPPRLRRLDGRRAACRSPRRSTRTARPIGTCAAFHSPASPRMLTTISTGIWYGISSDVSAFSELPRPLDCSITVGSRPPRYKPGGDPERLLLARRQHQPDVAELALELAQHVRQRIVGHVDDVAAAGGVDAGADARPTRARSDRDSGFGIRHSSPRMRADRSHRPPSTTSVTPLTNDAASDTDTAPRSRCRRSSPSGRADIA